MITLRAVRKSLHLRQLVERGMLADDARLRAKGLLPRHDGERPRGDGYQFDDYTPCEVLSSIACTVNKLFPKEQTKEE